MEKQIMASFYATSFDGKTFEFIINNDNTIDCPELDLYSYRFIDLKPRFVMWSGEKNLYI